MPQFDSIRNTRARFAFGPDDIKELVRDHGLVILRGGIVECDNLTRALASYASYQHPEPQRKARRASA